jgi:hypothetical protein
MLRYLFTSLAYSATEKGAEVRIEPGVGRQKRLTGGASHPATLVSAAWVKSLTYDSNSSGKIIENWGVAARCCGGTGRHYGARLPAGYQRQGAQSETIGKQTGRDGSLFRVSRPV